MSQEAKGLSIGKLIALYIALFVICYSGVMLLKYVTHSEMTWIETGIFMFVIGNIVLIFNRFPSKSKSR